MWNGIKRGAPSRRAGQKGQRAINVTHVREYACVFVEKWSPGNGGRSKLDGARSDFRRFSGYIPPRRLLSAKRPGNTWPGKSNEAAPFEKSSTDFQILAGGMYMCWHITWTRRMAARSAKRQEANCIRVVPPPLRPLFIHRRNFSARAPLSAWNFTYTLLRSGFNALQRLHSARLPMKSAWRIVPRGFEEGDV